MLLPLYTVRAELIYKDYKTEGSNPLVVLADDGDEYITKTTVGPVPWNEVINEVICGYLAQCWHLAVPAFSLVRISQHLANAFQKRHGVLSTRHYGGCLFDDRLFFGSRQVPCQTEVQQYLTGPTHHAQMQQFHHPLDWLKIGLFDIWVGNKDRRPDNLNVLLGSRDDGRFTFVPIDHTAAFAYYQNYQEVTDNRLFIEPGKRILSHQFTQSIVKFAPPDQVWGVKDDVLACIANAVGQLDFIFSQVPAEWGFSRKAKEHLKQFLSDQARNERIASDYLLQLTK